MKFLLFLSCSLAVAQVPQITSGGVVNSASWSSPVVPGSLVSIFGSNLATAPQSASPTYPFKLGGTSVAVNGIPAALSFVSPGQINLQLPSSLSVPSSAAGQGITLGSASIVVTTSGGVSAPATFATVSAYPGLFTNDGSGCGQAAALNITPAGAVSVNSPSNSAAPGDYIALFGTGFGLAATQPADGAAAPGAASLQTIPELLVDGNPAPAPLYAGLAPSMVGVDQINFQLSASTRNGCAVSVSALQAFGSPPVTISVQGGRSQCVDPPIQSYGQISLFKTFFSAPGNPPLQITDSFSASFPSGPNVQPPMPPAIVVAPQWASVSASSGPVAVNGVIYAANLGPSFLRTCAVPGFTQLSAGPIQVQAPGGTAVTINPGPLATGGVYYGQALTTGFIGPGTYTISGPAGNAVNLQASVKVGSPIQIQTPFSPGTVISSSQPFTIQWTGGDPGSLVRVTLLSENQSLYAYANATEGSLTIPPICSGVNCSFSLQASASAELSVEVSPASANITTVSVPGITGPVQLSWSYSYAFAGLTLGP